jgi:hypothetical protein
VISFSKLIEIVNAINSTPEIRVGRKNPRLMLLSLLGKNVVSDDEFVVVKARIKVGKHSHIVYVRLKVSNNIVTIEHMSVYPAKVAESLAKQREAEQSRKRFEELLALISNSNPKLPA